MRLATACVAACTALALSAASGAPARERIAGTGAGLGVQLDKGSGSYNITLDGAPYLTGAPTFLQAGGKMFSTADGSLKMTGAPSSFSGADSTGSFAATQLQWAAGGVPFATTFRVYSGGKAIVFAQDFPKGAPGTATGDKDGVLSSFPAFAWAVPAGAGAANADPRGYLAFAGDMTGSHSISGVWGDPKSTPPGGITGSGPVVQYSADLSTSTVTSAYSSFFAASQAFKDGALSYGCMGNVTELPEAFNLETVLVLSDGGGINQAMDQWGDLLLGRYGKTRQDKNADYTLSWLGYSTDNGAFYYYNTEDNNTKNYEQTMLDVKAYADKMDIPYSYWLADSWWYYKSSHGDGVLNWTAMTSVFPHNFSYVYQQTEWLVQGHNRYWDGGTQYAKQNGGVWDFNIDTAHNIGIPTQQDFWDWLLRESRKAFGLVVYEQDWLDVTTDRHSQLTQSATLGRTWLLQMGHGAAANDMCIQYCMSHVRHILQSVEIPAVSQARASGDYSENASEQWNVGTTGILAHAVGIAPSKDNYWSTTYQSGNKWGPGRFEPYNRLQAATITLSAGPIAPSDKIGDSDRDLIMRSCMDDGRLLVPSRPGTHIDAFFARKAIGSGAAGPDGQIWTTGTQVSGRWYANVLGVELTSAYSATPATLGGHNAPGWAESGTSLVGFEANATTSIVTVTAAAPLAFKACDKYDFQYYNLAQRVAGEWTLLGEPGKWVAVSAARFDSVTSISGASPSMAARIRGANGEQVTVNFLPPASSTVVSVTCTIGESLRATVNVPSKACTPM